MHDIQQPAWGRSREFEITTRSSGRMGLTTSTTGDLEDDEEEEEDTLVHGRRKRKVAFMPSVGALSSPYPYPPLWYSLGTFSHADTTHTIYYRGHWLRITRTKRYPDYGHSCALKIRYASVPSRLRAVLVPPYHYPPSFYYMRRVSFPFLLPHLHLLLPPCFNLIAITSGACPNLRFYRYISSSFSCLPRSLSLAL